MWIVFFGMLLAGLGLALLGYDPWVYDAKPGPAIAGVILYFAGFVGFFFLTPEAALWFAQ